MNGQSNLSYNSLKLIIKFTEPEQHYFLIRLLSHLDPNQPIKMTVKELAKCIGVTDQIVKIGLKFLTESKYLQLSKEPTTKGGRGRPKSCYEFTNDFLNAIKNPRFATGEILYPQLIADILSPDKEMAVNKKRHPLKISNRVLMAVLLAHADDCGVVRNLGLSDLSALTGMNKERLRSQTQRLLQLGYIRSHIPGMTGQSMIGAVKSIYVLNLGHIAFGKKAIQGLFMLYPLKYIYEEKLNVEAKQVYELGRLLFQTQSSNERKKYGLPSFRRRIHVRQYLKNEKTFYELGERADAIAPFFKHGLTHSNLCLMQILLELYASALLSRCWSDLDNNDFDDETLRQVICADFIPSRFLSTDRSPDELPRQEGIDYLIDMIFQLSLIKARYIKAFMIHFLDLSELDSQEIRLEEMAHLILPVRRKTPELEYQFCIASHYRGASLGQEAINILVTSHCIDEFFEKVEIVRGAQNVPRHFQHYCGLRTHINAKSVSWPEPKANRATDSNQQNLEDS